MEISAAIAAAESAPEPQEAVEAVQVRRGEWAAATRAVGTVVALRQVEIRNELPGTVVEVGFASGDIVEAGQALVRLDASQELALARRRAGGSPARAGRLRSTQQLAVRWMSVSVLDLDSLRARTWRPPRPACRPRSRHRQENAVSPPFAPASD